MGLQVGDSEQAERYFARSAYVDLDDNQGNTEEGMHIASAGGTWQIAVHGFGGFLLSHDRLHFDPALPESWERLRFTVRRKGAVVRADLGHDEHRFELVGAGRSEETIVVDGAEVVLEEASRSRCRRRQVGRRVIARRVRPDEVQARALRPRRRAHRHRRRAPAGVGEHVRGLPRRRTADAEPYTEQDYYEHLDGVGRAKGVRNVLGSRGIDLPEGHR